MARLTRSERLGKQGIVFFEVDGVLARLTRAQSIDPAASMRAVEAVSVMAPLALHMRRRVRDEQRTADGPFSGYGRGGSVIMSEQYQRAAGLAKRYYRNSAAMHGALKNAGKLFSVTGKMWESLQVRGSGTSRAIVDFEGSSIGRGTVVKTRRTKKGVILKNVPETVRNSAKARGIFDTRKINIIEPTQDELTACAATLTETAARGIQVAWGAQPTVDLAGSFARLVGDVRDNIERNR